jgi:hypothetical protein
LPLFTFNPIALSQDFLCDALWKVLLDLFQLLIEGKFSAGWFRRDGEVVAALSKEFELAGIGGVTFRADSFKLGSAFPAKLLTSRILILAFRAFHIQRPSKTASR